MVVSTWVGDGGGALLAEHIIVVDEGFAGWRRAMGEALTLCLSMVVAGLSLHGCDSTILVVWEFDSLPLM